MNSTNVEVNRWEPSAQNTLPEAPAGVFLSISPFLLKVSAWPFIGGSEARLQLDYVHHTDRGLKSPSARKTRLFPSFFLLRRSKNATLVKAKANTASSVGRTGSFHSHINTSLSLRQLIPHLFIVQNSIAYARTSAFKDSEFLHVRKLGLSCSLLLILRY